MYTFSNKLMTFSIILMVLGALGVGYGFMTSHKSLDEVKTILADRKSTRLNSSHVVISYAVFSLKKKKKNKRKN